MVFGKEEYEQLILHKAHVIFVKRSFTDLQIHVYDAILKIVNSTILL